MHDSKDLDQSANIKVPRGFLSLNNAVLKLAFIIVYDISNKISKNNRFMIKQFKRILELSNLVSSSIENNLNAEQKEQKNLIPEIQEIVNSIVIELQVHDYIEQKSNILYSVIESILSYNYMITRTQNHNVNEHLEEAVENIAGSITLSEIKATFIRILTEQGIKISGKNHE